MRDFFRRLIRALAVQPTPPAVETGTPSFCPRCGTNDQKLAECSTCGVWFCAGECYSLHKRPSKAVAR